MINDLNKVEHDFDNQIAALRLALKAYHETCSEFFGLENIELSSNLMRRKALLLNLFGNTEKSLNDLSSIKEELLKEIRNNGHDK